MVWLCSCRRLFWTIAIGRVTRLLRLALPSFLPLCFLRCLAPLLDGDWLHLLQYLPSIVAGASAAEVAAGCFFVGAVHRLQCDSRRWTASGGVLFLAVPVSESLFLHRVLPSFTSSALPVSAWASL